MNIKKTEPSIITLALFIFMNIIVSASAEGKSCESVGGVSSGGACLCPTLNRAIDPDTQYCAENIICRDGQTLEHFLENDGQALARFGRNAYTIRKVNSLFARNRFFIVYLDSRNRVRIKESSKTSSAWSFDPIKNQQDMDLITLSALEIGLEQPLLNTTYCNANLGQNVSRPEQEIIIEEPLFLESEWQNNTLISTDLDFHTTDIERTVQLLQECTGLERESLRGAQFFHGSSSASLLAFTEYNQFKGELVPIGLLESKHKVPFSGEIWAGRTGINSVALSTTHAGNLIGALNYAKAKSWDITIGQQEIEYVKNLQNCYTYKNIFDINQARLSEWNKLNAIEKDLVNNSFPVLYGIRPMENRKKDLVDVISNINDEVGIRGIVDPKEIKVIFVPYDRIAQVSALIETNFPLIAIEPIEIFTNKNI